jgi:cold shock protein
VFGSEVEVFFQHESEATEAARALRAEGFVVEVRSFEGGYALVASGSADALAELATRVEAEAAAQPRRRMTGTVRWWKEEKGYGRITGDDDYVYFCHFAALEIEGYKTLRPGQRVEFEPVERMADRGRTGAVNVRLLDS